MRLLHTGDWHVGKGLRGADRHDEHRAVLGEIVSIAERESVDLVIVAGDLFDSSAPPPAAEQLVYETLLGLARSGADVAVIAGNHDHPGRLRAVSPLLALGRVHLVTEPTRPADGGVRSFTAGDGSEVRLAMLPFVSKRGIVRAEALMDQPAFELAQSYSDRVRRLIETLTADFGPDTVNLIAAHAFVLGGEAGGGERAAHLVDEYAVTAPSFPPTASYVALGHLHRPQRLPGGGGLHYAGSPLALDFGEVDQAKQVNLVTVEPGSPARVEAVRLTQGRPLRTVVGSLDELLGGAVDPDDDAWLRVIVRDAARPGLADEVRRELGPRVVDVRVENTAISSVDEIRWTDHQQRSPQELFGQFLAERGETDERLSSLFDELLDGELTSHAEPGEVAAER